jgi:hypothetical protein
MTHSRASAFIPGERARQAAYFAKTAPAEALRPEAAYRLSPMHRSLNLAPSIRATATSVFGAPPKAAWHRHADHGLSSQVACVNFLMPLAARPALLGRVIGGALGLEGTEMLPVETGPDGEPWFVGFEWIGRADYLNEWPQTGKATRGANATSADAVVRFRHEGRIETVLIEWKYTERYGAPLNAKGNATRVARYRDLVFAPAGPIRSDLGLRVEDFFWEPFYQLLRQQMLARRMEDAREDGTTRVRVLHISPAGNAHLHKVTAPALRVVDGVQQTDAFAAFSKVLATPADGVSRFLSRTTEAVVGPHLAAEQDCPEDRAWAEYLRGRYGVLGNP